MSDSSRTTEDTPKGKSVRAAGARTRWNRFAIDPRSLALFRIAIALVLLTDLAIRATDLKVMYTDGGMFPRADICRLITSVWNWSFHFASGSPGYQAMLFGIAALLAAALMLGYETRIAVIGSWLMLISIHHRVPVINSGAEILLRMLLFWAMFLPLGRSWSLDAWLAKRRSITPAHGREEPVTSVGSTAILLQMGLMYFFSAFFKTNSQWTGGTALSGVFAHDFYSSPAGVYLLQFPGLLSVLTRVTLAVEWAGPLLLFFARNAWLRLAGIVVLALMHIGIGICLEVGLFSYVALAGLTLFLPAAFWNSRLFARLRRSPEPVSGRAAVKDGPPLQGMAQRVCMVCLIYVLISNLNSFQSRPLAAVAPEKWVPFSRGLGLAQRWGMFEAVPSKDGWYVARARLTDGSEVDLLRNGAALDWRRPAYPAGLYPNHYWQKLFREMAYEDGQGFQFFRAPAARYLCREWNSRNGPEKQVVEFDFVYCMEGTTGTTEGSSPRTFREQLLHLDLDQPDDR